MKKKIFYLLTVFVALVLAAACSKKAEDKTENKTETKVENVETPNFTANFKFISKAENFAGKIFSSKDKTKMETPNGTFITRADKNVVWVIMPGEKMFIEYPLEKKNTMAGFHKLPNETERKLLGSEIINGQKADKYQVTYTVGSKQDTIYQWIVSGKGIPIKTSALDGSWSYEYSDIDTTAPQPEQTYEIPEDYKEFKMPSDEPVDHY